MAKSKDYQSLSDELDAVLARMQRSDIKVDDAVKLYEEGLKLVAQLEAQLKEAENKIQQLKLAAAEG